MYSLKKSQEAAHEGAIWAVTWVKIDSENELLATGSLDEKIKLWQISDDDVRVQRVMTGHALAVVSLDAQMTSSNMGTSLLASASMDGTLRTYDAQQGSPIRTIEAGTTEVWSCSLSPSADRVASGTHSGCVNVWCTTTAERQMKMDTMSKAFIFNVKFSPDGRFIACACGNGIPYLFDAVSGKELQKLPGHSKAVRSLTFSPDSKNLITCSEDMHINAYDLVGGQQIDSISGHNSWVTDLSFSPATEGGGWEFASSSCDKTVKVWDWRQRQAPIRTFPSHNDQVWSIAYNSDGTKLASVGDDCAVKIYDTIQEG